MQSLIPQISDLYVGAEHQTELLTEYIPEDSEEVLVKGGGRRDVSVMNWRLKLPSTG